MFPNNDRIHSSLFDTVLMIFFLLIFLQKDEVYLNLVLEYIPETVYRVARHYSKSKQTIPIIFIKVGLKKIIEFQFFLFYPPYKMYLRCKTFECDLIVREPTTKTIHI